MVKKKEIMYCVEFWDFGQWNEMADTRRKYRQECVEIAQKLNRGMTKDQKAAFEGHSYRVRAVKD